MFLKSKKKCFLFLKIIKKMTTLESENSSKIYFTEQTKMSLNLIELRLDNHLKRIMKEYRLSNLSNAIKKLSLETRICEKLLEIMVIFNIYSNYYYSLFCFVCRILVMILFIVKCQRLKRQKIL